MNLEKIYGLILIGVLSSITSHANDHSFLCVAERAVGFSYDKTKEEWENTNFKTDKKYVLSTSSKGGKKWEVKVVGYSFRDKCVSGFSKEGFIECKGLFDFTMNSKSLRYIVVQKSGYVVKEYPKSKVMDSDFSEGSITPYIEIGKCSPI